MSALRVLAVHQGGAVGGAPVSLLKLMQGLDAHTFEPHVVFTEPGSVLDYARDLGVAATVVPTGGAFYYSAHARLSARMLAQFVRTFPRSVRTAQAVLHAHRPDVVHLNTSVLLAWAAAARRQRVPVVWVVREVLGPNHLLRHWHASFISRRATRVVAISKAVRNCFPAPYTERVKVVYNAVDLQEFDLAQLALRNQARQQLGVPEDAPAIALVGSVQRPKGHWLVLQALTELPRVHLIVVAGGVPASYAQSTRGRIKRALRRPLDNLDALMRDAQRAGVTGRIHVTGFRRDVAAILAASDLLVFPSLEPEGFGRPIIEAMAMARPVVATDVGPSREILGPDAGCLVEPRPEHMARALRDLLCSPEQRKRMGAAGRQRVEKCFELQHQLESMQKMYAEAAAIG